LPAPAAPILPVRGNTTERALTVMQMVKSGEIEGVLSVLRVLSMMQATCHVNTDTLQAQGLLARGGGGGRQVRQIFRQQFQLCHGHRAVG